MPDAVADATFERQAELLETIHSCARELRELAGNALVITIKPAGTSTRRSNSDIAREGDAAVLDVFNRHPGEWLRRRDVVADASIPYSRATRVFNRLVKQGALEHNGENTNRSRYRLPESQLPGGASSNGHRPSAHEPIDASVDPHSPLERVRRACAEDAATITELAMRLDLPRREIASCVEYLLDQDLIVKCGERQPLNHTVYGAHDE